MKQGHARSAQSRDLDVVLWGATGFTGRLVAEHLATRYGAGERELRWALAGRDRAKLEAVRARLTRLVPEAQGLEILLADSDDRPALDAMAARARVVLSTVGPFARHGSTLVAACAALGTDYCDTTGEVQWVRTMIDRHHVEAERSGARIVHCCGFDSIPSDLGVLMLQRHMLREYGQRCREIRYIIHASAPGFSGGTLASMMHAAAESRTNPLVREVFENPYALAPPEKRQGPPLTEARGARRDPDLGWQVGPFMMAIANTRIVHRTNALLDDLYGHPFQYQEAMRLPSGAKGWLMGWTLEASSALFTPLAGLTPVQRALQPLLPAPGEGPSDAQRARSHFDVTLIGAGEGGDASPTPRLRGCFAAQGDPGYGETAKMVAESAICLATDETDGIHKAGGILTPAASMGEALTDRLRAVGMRIDVGPLEPVP